MEKTTKRPQNNYGLMQREALKHIKGNDLRVYADLITYADKYGKCFPGVTRIADDTGLNNRNVQKHLANLEEAGWIKRNYRTNSTTMYQLYFVDTSAEPKKKALGTSKSDGASKSDVAPLSLLDRSGMSKRDRSGVSESDVQTDQLTDHNNRPQEQVVAVTVVSGAAENEKKKYKLSAKESSNFRKLWNLNKQDGESQFSAISAYTRYCSMNEPNLLKRFNKWLDGTSDTYMTNQMKQIHKEYQDDKSEKKRLKKESVGGGL